MIWESLKVMSLLFRRREIPCVDRIRDLSLSDAITQNTIHQKLCAVHVGGLFLQRVDSGYALLFPLKDLSYEIKLSCL